MVRAFTAILLMASMAAVMAAQEEPGAAEDNGHPIYQDDPAIISIIKALKPGEVVRLPPFKVVPEDATKYHHTFKNGPYRRDYGNKMPYAPDRKTGMYCGANHGVPHRLSDVWEYHLGGNTWHLICPPGRDAYQMRQLGITLKKLEKDPEKNAEAIAKISGKIKEWHEGCEMKDGYLQDTANGGPVRPWHTWDGITYNHVKRQLYWNVLDTQHTSKGQQLHQGKIKSYAKAMGLGPEPLLKQLKPASSMYMYDPAKKRWMRQQGEGPFPLMRGMGATLHYIPDIDATIFYCCHGGTPGGYTEGMWSYDANTNRWKELIPGGKVRHMVHTLKIAPADEIQVAYSTRSKKLAAVNKNATFIYDIAENEWSRGKDNEAFAHDATSVFVYDSNADVFLLLGRKGKSQWAHSPFSMYAYSLSTDSWEKVELPLLDDSKGPEWRKFTDGYTGYYDPEHNVFVLYGKRGGCCIYRHKDTGCKVADDAE